MQDMNFPAIAAPDWDSAPAMLAERPQWLLWRLEAKEGQAKPGKIPYYVSGGRRTGDQGSEKDRARLTTLAVARKAYERGGWHGVGLALLPDDGLIGIDIDGALDATTGEPTDRCRAIINACQSFTEISPSGKGVHIIVQGTTTTNKSNDIGLEVFCGKQFFTFTAHRFAGTPADVLPIDPGALRRLHATIDEAKAKRKAPPVGAAPSAAVVSIGNDFAAVNEAAMRSLSAWVTALFPAAQTNGPGFRVTSKALNRDLQEDLSIHPDGIQDFGLERGFTPIDLVMQWLPAEKPQAALKWLAARVGIELKPPQGRSKPKQKNRDEETSAGGVGGGGGGSDDGGGPPTDFGDDPEREALLAHMVQSRGKPVDCRENVMYCLLMDPALTGLVRQNEFTQLIERGRVTPWGHPLGDWNEEDDLMLGEYLLRTWQLGIKATVTLRNGVLMAARQAKYNPVHDLVRSEKWDGVERLPHWLTDVYAVKDRPYTRLIGRCFVMGMVQRAMRPGCKFDYMLILKSEQGLKKSSAFRVLAEPFFTDNAIRMGDKDSLMAMQLVWLAESAELESLNKSETTQIKQFLSAQDDLYRPPYGAQMIKRPRHAVNVGTTNADQFLKDATGDRRFWPLEVHVVNLEVLRGMRRQLFAEALHRLEAGERYWPDREEEKTLVFPEQEQFKRGDTWEDLIDAYVNKQTRDKTDNVMEEPNAERQFFTTIEIYDKALGIKADRIDGNGQMDTRIGNAMRALNFERHRETAGRRRRGFQRKPPPPPLAAPADGSGAQELASMSEQDDETPF